MADQTTNSGESAKRATCASRPQKARLVVDMIRGQQAGDAINILSAYQQADCAGGREGVALGDCQCREQV